MTEHERTGVVVWFDEIRGYGFIQQETPIVQGLTLFVSFEDVEREGFRTLSQGERVGFARKPGKGGPKAIRVAPLAKSVRP